MIGRAGVQQGNAEGGQALEEGASIGIHMWGGEGWDVMEIGDGDGDGEEWDGGENGG